MDTDSHLQASDLREAKYPDAKPGAGEFRSAGAVPSCTANYPSGLPSPFTESRLHAPASPTYAQMHVAVLDVIAQERPNHEHYDDPDECALCRLFVVMGYETREEQQDDA